VEAARFDTYYRYQDLTRVLYDYAAQYPGLVRLRSIGTSFEGRDIWLVTITCFATGPDTGKPALWVDANIHSAELVASAAAPSMSARGQTRTAPNGRSRTSRN
jgi:murein tripeptide amidase MpaA